MISSADITSLEVTRTACLTCMIVTYAMLLGVSYAAAETEVTSEPMLTLVPAPYMGKKKPVQFEAEAVLEQSPEEAIDESAVLRADDSPPPTSETQVFGRTADPTFVPPPPPENQGVTLDVQNAIPPGPIPIKKQAAE